MPVDSKTDQPPAHPYTSFGALSTLAKTYPGRVWIRRSGQGANAGQLLMAGPQYFTGGNKVPHREVYEISYSVDGTLIATAIKAVHTAHLISVDDLLATLALQAQGIAASAENHPQSFHAQMIKLGSALPASTASARNTPSKPAAASTPTKVDIELTHQNELIINNHLPKLLNKPVEDANAIAAFDIAANQLADTIVPAHPLAAGAGGGGVGGGGGGADRAFHWIDQIPERSTNSDLRNVEGAAAGAAGAAEDDDDYTDFLPAKQTKRE